MPNKFSDEETPKRKKVVVAQVVRSGEKLIIPKDVSTRQAIDVLQRQLVYEETDAQVREMFDTFPWDGAIALSRAMDEMFGFQEMVAQEGFFGDKIPPSTITVASGPNQTIQVMWGKIEVPQLGGYLVTDSMPKDGKLVFMLAGVIKRRHEEAFRKLGELVRKNLREASIYRGKAVRVRFKDDDGDPMPLPEPRFLDLAQVKPEELIFPADLDLAIHTSLFTPIERSQECREQGIPLKRGVLLVGPYGTGKTLAAYVTAKKAVENGWTFVYVEHASELVEAVRFALAYQPAVIFCEDVDQVSKGQRTQTTNDLLNVVDGLDSKDTELMFVLTSNHAEDINPALLRPGRMDAVIQVGPPNAEAAERLIRQYGRGLVPADEDLGGAGRALAGQIPATIRECVERAKLTAIYRAQKGEPFMIRDQDIVTAANTMKMHWDLLNPKKEEKVPEIVQAAQVLGNKLTEIADGNHSDQLAFVR